MKPDYAPLIERLEKAEGPDRELDVRVWHALFPDQRVMLDHGKGFGPGPKRPARYGVLSDIDIDGWSDWEGLAMHMSAERVSASIDAALALVEKKRGAQAIPDIIRRALSRLGKEFSWHVSPPTPEQIRRIPLAILTELLTEFVDG